MDCASTSTKVGDPAYIEEKRQELRLFFEDARLPKEVIDKAIENELKPITEGPRPYIQAAGPGEVKSEFEVMTGQPFTDIGEHTKPLNRDEIKEMLKGNPIIAEKARQIQILKGAESLGAQPFVGIPLNEINLAKFSDIRDELANAAGDAEKINSINYRNMTSLLGSVTEYEAKCGKAPEKSQADESESEGTDSSEEREFEAIEKAVSQYTDKSYETRFKETQEMLLSMADEYDKVTSPTDTKKRRAPLELYKDPILKESSSQLIKGQVRRSAFEEIKESYAINEAMNIPLKNNPVKPDLSGKIKQMGETQRQKKVNEEIINVEEVFPKTMETKLKDTENALREINSVLSNSPVSKQGDNKEESKSDELENKSKNTLDGEIVAVPNTRAQKFDERMEATLQNALEHIFEVSSTDNRENNEMEFKEMRNLAHNIVEGAENLSTLIREDITNKLNTMNELLNDVNEALDNSRKSNLVYKKLKEEGEACKQNTYQRSQRDKLGQVTMNEVTDSEGNGIENPATEEPTSRVSDAQIDDINSAIRKLNSEINAHELIVNQSKANYEMRNSECTDFMNEVDEVLLKSRGILHPNQSAANPALDQTKNIIDQPAQEDTAPENPKIVDEQKLDENEEKVRKELWDVDLSAAIPDDKQQRIEEFNKQQAARNKRIDTLLYEIKDKMKDNKEVLRIANNLLRREESKKKKAAEEKDCIAEVPALDDEKAQGDNANNAQDVADANELPLQSDVPPAEGEVKVSLVEIRRRAYEKKKAEEAAKEEARQREYQERVEKELEDMKKGPRMTKEFIKDHCKQHKLYCTPYLNDILYLHFKGFAKIENLEEYIGLKCIFLENNGIEKIEGLDTLSELKCLYMHYNVVRKIENLSGCPKLDTLNLDHNFVGKIENLDQVPDLHTLSIAHNMLRSVEDLEQLRDCLHLSVLDLSYNRIEDPLIVDVLAEMNLLKVLVLTGNPVVRSIPAYRKTLTLRLKQLLNLDNRPVFPRDRACAEAWQRGGVQEEIAERKRWIARDQEKVMQSVRYLIRMRDDSRAQRQQQEERETVGLPPKDEATDETTIEHDIKDENKDIPKKLSFQDETCPSTVEEKFGPEEVTTRDGMPVDMMSASEDSTSNSSNDGSDIEEILAVGKKKNEERKHNETPAPETSKIEWSHVEQKKHLVQEVSVSESGSNEEPPPQELWPGYGYQQTTTASAKDFTSEFSAMSDLLFNQQPHVDQKKTFSKMLEDTKKALQEKKVAELSETDAEKEKWDKPDAKMKTLIEVIEPGDEPFVEITETADNCEAKPLNKIITDDSDIKDRGRKVELEKSMDKTTEDCKTDYIKAMENIIPHGPKENAKEITDASYQTKAKNPLKKIFIKEVETTDSKRENILSIMEMPEDSDDHGDDKDTKCHGDTAKKRENNTESEEAEKDDRDDVKPTTSNADQVRERSVAESSEDGTSLVSYFRRSRDPDAVELTPSAEDRPLLAELDREQRDRERRIATGLPPSDPMKLYDQKTMEQYHRLEDRQPAHEVKQRSFYTTYKTDNAFDRIALSQLTKGDKPDESKAKLTVVPGAVLFRYSEQQMAPPPVTYEIGDEQIDSQSSSDSTISIEATSDYELVDKTKTTKISEAKSKDKKKGAKSKGKQSCGDKAKDAKCEAKELERVKEKQKEAKNVERKMRPGVTRRPATAKAEKKSMPPSSTPQKAEKSTGSGDKPGRGHAAWSSEDEDDFVEDTPQKPASHRRPQFMPRAAPAPAPAAARARARRHIIRTMNLCRDPRFPSNGNQSDAASDALIEQSVAEEILQRTVWLEERALYRQYDVITSRAGNIDNRTNAILEHMSDQLSDQYTLPEVSQLLEEHMDEAEQSYRAAGGRFERFVPVASPHDSDTDNEFEPTLVPSHDTSFEDTLTEENDLRKMAVIREKQEDRNDIGDGNKKDGSDDNKKDGNKKEGNDNDKGDDDENGEENGGGNLNDDSGIVNDKSMNDSAMFNDAVLDVIVLSPNEASVDEVFEDCVDDVVDEDVADGNDANQVNNEKEFDRREENYSLEMKLALGIEDTTS